MHLFELEVCHWGTKNQEWYLCGDYRVCFFFPLSEYDVIVIIKSNFDQIFLILYSSEKK